MSSEALIKYYTSLMFNAWPSEDYFFLNGWILRLSNEKCRRSSSLIANEYYGESVENDLSLVEQIFEKYGHYPRFIIHDHVKPSNLVPVLISHGYNRSSDYLVVMSCKKADFCFSQQLTDETVKYYQTNDLDPTWFSFINDHEPEEIRLTKETANRIITPEKQFFYAVDQNSVVGSLFSVLDPMGNMFVGHLFVAENYRRKKIALALMDKAIIWGCSRPDLRLKNVWFQVYSTNKEAISFYTKIGFSEEYSYSYLQK